MTEDIKVNVDVAYQADITVKFGSSTLSVDDVNKFFNVQYVNNVQQGTARVILSPKFIADTEDETKNSNPYTGSKSVTFKIKKSAIQDQMKPAEK